MRSGGNPDKFENFYTAYKGRLVVIIILYKMLDTFPPVTLDTVTLVRKGTQERFISSTILK